jgi:hypothetical protein
MGIQKSVIDYEALLSGAMHSVIYKALQYIEDDTMPEGHFFYISFLTTFDGVEISSALKQKYPTELTIILQHHFMDLVVEEDGFAVTLSFNDRDERLVVPYNAISRFSDPSTGIEFSFTPQLAERKQTSGAQMKEVTASQKSSKVISLADFKKNNSNL